MSDFMLNENDILSKVTKYELNRENGRMWIDVHKFLAGTKENLYIAIPSLLVSEANKEYMAKGETEEEALKKCLEKIKDVPSNKIFPTVNR